MENTIYFLKANFVYVFSASDSNYCLESHHLAAKLDLNKTIFMLVQNQETGRGLQ